VSELMMAGEFFFDLIFHHLPRLPRLGEELKTDNFALALGGGAVTTALTLTRLGRRVELASAVGDTVLDSFALSELRRGKVNTRSVRQEKGSMGAITVAVSLQRDRYFLTYMGANMVLERHLLSAPLRRRFGRARHVHFGLSPRRWEPFVHLVGWLRGRGVSTSWDLGWNPQAAREPAFRRLCGFLDVAFYNRDEALRYSGAANPQAALERLGRTGQCVVIKLGAKGALAIGPDGRARMASAHKVRAIETTGAGDAFNGGFLHAWVSGSELSECLRAGNICGALSTRVPGGSAGTPSRAELAQLLRRRK
jgi:sugar/nucleoside kinase (ribokinase family)